MTINPNWHTDRWTDRAAAAAAAIPTAARSVVDLGAGTQVLRRHLPDSITVYTPVDAYHHPTTDTINLDVTRPDWTLQGLTDLWDVVTLIGLLEHVPDPFAVLTRASGLAPTMLVTYANPTRDVNFANTATVDEISSHLAQLRPFVSLDTIVDGRHNLWKAIAS